MACEADLSEVEQQREPLAAKDVPGLREGLTLRRWLSAAAGVLLLGAAVLVFYAQRSTVLGAAGSTHVTADAIQRYALKKYGFTVPQWQLEKVQRYVDNAKHPARGAFAPRLLEEEKSSACQAALDELNEKVVDKVMQSAFQAMVACFGDSESDTCKDAEAKLNSLEKEVMADCKKSGDSCHVTEGEGDQKEEEDICLPKACHDNQDLAKQFFEQQVSKDAHHNHCDDCVTTVTCGETKDEAACDAALQEMQQMALDKVMAAVLEAMSKCFADQESETCKEAEEKLHKLEDEVMKDCKASGDSCHVTEGEGDEKEALDVCLPKACHGNQDLAKKFFEQQMEHKGGHSHCDDCTTTVTCG